MSAAQFFEIAGSEDGGRIGLILPAVHPQRPIGSLMPAADGDGTPGYACSIEIAGLRSDDWAETITSAIADAMRFVELIAGLIGLDMAAAPYVDPTARHGFEVAQPQPDTLTLSIAGRRVGAVFEAVLPIVGRRWRWRIELRERRQFGIMKDLPGALAAAWLPTKNCAGRCDGQLLTIVSASGPCGDPAAVPTAGCLDQMPPGRGGPGDRHGRRHRGASAPGRDRRHAFAGREWLAQALRRASAVGLGTAEPEGQP